MSKPRRYSPEQVMAVRALAAINPPPPHELIAKTVGVHIETVRYYLYGRNKVTLIAPWAMDVLEASAQQFKGNSELAAYHLVSAAKHLLKKSP